MLKKQLIIQTVFLVLAFVGTSLLHIISIVYSCNGNCPCFFNYIHHSICAHLIFFFAVYGISNLIYQIITLVRTKQILNTNHS